MDWLQEQGDNLGRWGKSRDETAWCSVFVGACLEEVGVEGTHHALARSWATWGKPSKLRRGAIIVIKRKQTGADAATGSRAGFHVGFLLSVSKRWFRIRGGNQGNSVSDAAFSKAKYDMVAIRWPLGV